MRFNLINLRKSKKLNQEQMAKKLKTSRPNYSKIENALAEPTVEQLYILHDEFGVDDVLECVRVFEIEK